MRCIVEVWLKGSGRSQIDEKRLNKKVEEKNKRTDLHGHAIKKRFTPGNWGTLRGATVIGVKEKWFNQ